MKNTLFLCLWVVVLVVSWCKQSPYTIDKEPVSADQNYVWTYHDNNYIRLGVMNLAWNELEESIIKEEIALATDDEEAQKLIASLSSDTLTKQDLDKKSYYVKSGFGKNIVKKINKEVRKKFPKKSLDDLAVVLEEKDFISYAFFFKNIVYKNEFTQEDVMFNDTSVEWFAAMSDDERETVGIVNYVNNDNFILNISLKDPSDELFFVKGFETGTPNEILAELAKYYSTGEYVTMRDNDIFTAPKLSFDYIRSYNELIGIPFLNEEFSNYIIGSMFENILFELDHKGVTVEAEALISGKSMSELPLEETPRDFSLDKPFWIIMKRADSSKPYLIIQINNDSFMVKK